MLLRVTKGLRDRCIALGMPEAADDVAVRAFVSDAVLEEKITPAEVKSLTAADASEGESRLLGKVGDVVRDLLTKANILGGDGASTVRVDGGAAAGASAASGGVGSKAYAAAGAAGGASGAQPDDAAATRIRLKSAVERFSDDAPMATYERSDNEMLRKNFGSRQLQAAGEGDGVYAVRMPSERSKAIAGIWFKHMAADAFRNAGLPVPPAFRIEKEWEKDLLQYVGHECKFVGEVKRGGQSFELEGEKAHNDLMVKTLLDDNTSGGLEAVPIEFDSAAILTPLLNGELFPLVSVINVSRRRIEAFSMANPTFQWGVADGTAATPFTTDAFIAAFDKTIFPVNGFMEIGNDFLADAGSVVDMGGLIVSVYGERFRTELDDVIATGNGTSQPTGLFTTASLATLSSADGAGAPPTLGDYEGLMFGVKKEFRNQAGLARSIFLSTDTSYSRSRSIPVSTADARRLFGMNHGSYTTFDHAHKVNETVGNENIGFFCMNRYRMYRRLGLQMEIDRTGRTNRLANKTLLCLRARMGGGLDHAGAGCVIDDAQA